MDVINKKIITFFVQPRISLGLFLVFLFFSAGVVWFAVASGTKTRESNLFVRHQIGEEVVVENVSFEVSQVRRDEQGAGPFTPRPGYLFVVPTIVLKNKQEKPFDFIPLLYMHIKDEQGNVYNVVAVPTEGGQLSGPIPSRGSLREEIGFEVARGARGLSLYFDPGTRGQQTVVIDLEQKHWWQFSK